MKNAIKTIALSLALISGVASAADGYQSADKAYAKPCVADARVKATTIAEAYKTAAGYDYDAELKLVDPSFPSAFRNPVRKEQFIHPIEFKVGFVRGFETRIRVMYSNSSKTEDLCVFQGIEFLDLTDAN
jgi:hypothetical protein